jgi:hypothetical protein
MSTLGTLVARFFSRKAYGGIIEAEGFQDWWGTAFTPAERATIRSRVSGPLSCFNHLDDGPPLKLEMHPRQILASMARWLEKDDVRPLGMKIARHCETIPSDGLGVIDAHFVLQDLLCFYYRCRNDGPDFLPRCEARCRDMIAMSRAVASAMKAENPNEKLPGHLGYGRLCWLLKKRGDGEGLVLRAEGEAMGWIVSI